jgi:Flp pilus assembly protein CpaB
MRLKTISVDARKSAAGLLSPGDRVDVQIFVRSNEQHGVSSPFTKIFLQNIRVYAVDQTIEKSADGSDTRSVAKTVSLIVTPAQANRINLAENMGEISLIPRNPDDDTVVDDAEQGADELFGRSTAGSREREQLVNRDEESDGPLAGFKSLMSQALAGAAQAAAAQPAVPAKPSFQMTIIYPNEVSRVKFSDSGEPLNDQTGGAIKAPTPFVTPTAAPAKAADDKPPVPVNFPIDLRLK